MAARPRFDERSRGRLFTEVERSSHHGRRSAVRNGAVKGGGHNEIVFKVASYTKSVRAAYATAAYINRTDGKHPDEPPLILRNEAGAALDADQVKAELRDWGLLRDDQNLSQKARKATPGQRRALTEAERYHRRQTLHAVISFPPELQVSREQADAIAGEALARTFGDRGHRFMYGIHTGPSGIVHAHAIIRVRNLHTNRSLRISPDDIHMIRENIAEIAKQQGITVRATRREDRENTREAVARGDQPLRPAHDYKTATRGPTRNALATAVPVWYARHGVEYEIARAGEAPRAPLPPAWTARLPPLPKKTNEVLRAHFVANYTDPEKARARFLEMAAENTRYAFARINRQPSTFGTLKPGAKPGRLTQEAIRLTAAWRTEARTRLDEAVRTEPAERRTARHAAMQAARSAYDRTRDSARRAADRARLDALNASPRPAPRPAPAAPTVPPLEPPVPAIRRPRVRIMWEKLKAVLPDRQRQPAQAGANATPSITPARSPSAEEIRQRAQQLDQRHKGSHGRARDDGGRER